MGAKSGYASTLVAMDLLVNIDVSDIVRAITFYTEAFGLTVTRRLGAEGAELSGWPVRVYLLQKPEGSIGAGESIRRYDRHWTPVQSTWWSMMLRRHCTEPWRRERARRRTYGSNFGVRS